LDDNRKIRFLLTDPETGDIRGEIFSDDKIIPAKIYDQIVAKGCPVTGDYRFHDIGRYSFIPDYAQGALVSLDLTLLEFNIFHLLAGKLKFNSNLCIHPNNRRVDISWLARKLDVKEETTKKAILSLQSKGILHYGGDRKNRTIFMNPYLVFRGRYINKTLEEMFKHTKFYTAYRNSLT
jgi:hypothetical protein